MCTLLAWRTKLWCRQLSLYIYQVYSRVYPAHLPLLFQNQLRRIDSCHDLSEKRLSVITRFVTPVLSVCDFFVVIWVCRSDGNDEPTLW